MATPSFELKDVGLKMSASLLSTNMGTPIDDMRVKFLLSKELRYWANCVLLQKPIFFAAGNIER